MYDSSPAWLPVGLLTLHYILSSLQLLGQAWSMSPVFVQLRAWSTRKFTWRLAGDFTDLPCDFQSIDWDCLVPAIHSIKYSTCCSQQTLLINCSTLLLGSDPYSSGASGVLRVGWSTEMWHSRVVQISRGCRVLTGRGIVPTRSHQAL